VNVIKIIIHFILVERDIEGRETLLKHMDVINILENDLEYFK
jgi:hypothetical protein